MAEIKDLSRTWPEGYYWRIKKGESDEIVGLFGGVIHSVGLDGYMSVGEAEAGGYTLIPVQPLDKGQ